MGFTSCGHRPHALRGPCLPPLLTILHSCSASYSFSFSHVDSNSMSADTQPMLLSNKPWAQGFTDAFVGDVGTLSATCSFLSPLSLWPLHYKKATVLHFNLTANIGIYHLYTTENCSSSLWAELVLMFTPGHDTAFCGALSCFINNITQVV